MIKQSSRSLPLSDSLIALSVWPAWPAEAELHPVEGGPRIQTPRDKFRAVVDANTLWHATLGSHVLQDPHDTVSGQPLTDLDGQALTAMDIDSRQQPKPLPAYRLIRHEVHAPALNVLTDR